MDKQKIAKIAKNILINDPSGTNSGTFNFGRNKASFLTHNAEDKHKKETG